jgi:hypothetical protein
MSFTLRPYCRFPVQCSVAYSAVPFHKLPLACCPGFNSILLVGFEGDNIG